MHFYAFLRENKKCNILDCINSQNILEQVSKANIIIKLYNTNTV